MIDLYCGDCLSVMPGISSSSVDMILADLPYGTTECSWDCVIPMEKLWPEYLRILRPSGVVVLTAMQPFTSMLVMSNPKMFKYEWIWEKGAATGFLNAKKQPLRAHESALVFYNKQPTYNPQKTAGHSRKTSKRKSVNSECYGKAIQLTEYDSTERYPRSVQFFSSDKQKGSYHPTQKPVDLGRYLIRTYTDAGMTVMDNTMGSGSFGVSAVLEGRPFIGIEKDEGYFGVASERINSASARHKPQLALFAS